MSDSRRVLIVEDDQVYQKQLQSALSDAGFEVFAATSGMAALEVLKKEKIDCILLDLLMPKMDGAEFFYKLQNELKMDIPTIILSNLSQAAHQDTIKEYLVKADTSLEEVIAAVRRNITVSE